METKRVEPFRGKVNVMFRDAMVASTDAALKMLDQPQLAEDARVFGRDAVLVREYETLRATLRARLKK